MMLHIGKHNSFMHEKFGFTDSVCKTIHIEETSMLRMFVYALSGENEGGQILIWSFSREGKEKGGQSGCSISPPGVNQVDDVTPASRCEAPIEEKATHFLKKPQEATQKPQEAKKKPKRTTTTKT